MFEVGFITAVVFQIVGISGPVFPCCWCSIVQPNEAHVLVMYYFKFTSLTIVLQNVY